MRTLRNLLALAVTAVGLFAPTLAAENKKNDPQEEKTVRLVWFPRFSPDGNWLITAHGSWDSKEGGEVRVCEAETGKPKFVIPTQRGVRTVAWAPKEKFFVSGDYGGMISFYDAETGKRTDQMKVPGNVEVLQISPDGKRLMAAVGDGSVRIWELPGKKEVYAWKKLHKGGIWGMTLSTDGKTVAPAGRITSRGFSTSKISRYCMNSSILLTSMA